MQAADEPARHATPRRCVLVVDDDPDARALLRRSLSGEFDIIEATNGAKALTSLELVPNKPVAAVVDVLMPEMDGLETIMELRGALGMTAIVAISGGGRTVRGDFLHIARELGAAATFQKPLDFGALRRTLVRLADAADGGGAPSARGAAAE